MEQTVYLDIFFLINFSMDFLGLFLSGRLLEKRVRLLRVVLAAVIGGAYACASLLLSSQIHGLAVFCLDALICLLMAFVSVFEKKAVGSSFAFALVFGAVSILLGGAMTALFNLFNKIGLDRLFGDSSQSDGMSVWFFLFLAIFSALFTVIGSKALKRKMMRKKGKLEIKYKGKSVSLFCICDSGNLLREPISRLPCIVVDTDAVGGIFSNTLLKAAKSGDLLSLDGYDRAKIRLIPISTAAGETMLLGIRADSVRLDMGKGACEVSAYIAFSREPIVAKGVKALVPSELALGTA